MNRHTTKGQLYREVADRIEQEGLDYTLRKFFSAKYADELDPELAKLWRQYLQVAHDIEVRVGVPDVEPLREVQPDARHSLTEILETVSSGIHTIQQKLEAVGIHVDEITALHALMVCLNTRITLFANEGKIQRSP